MNIPVIAFFNAQRGVGTTSLVYHLAWMYQRLGLQVLAIDLDPQARLTSMLLDDDRLTEIWTCNKQPNTVAKCLQPIMSGTSNLEDPLLEMIEDGFNLLSGSLGLCEFEDGLSLAWREYLSDGLNKHTEKSFLIISLFQQLFQQSAEISKADIVLLDLGPNLGAINRSALFTADYLITPLSVDIFSLQGLQYLQSALSRWQNEWLAKHSAETQSHLKNIQPLGYVIQQEATLLDQAIENRQKWKVQVNQIYNNFLSTKTLVSSPNTTDPYCLATFKNHQSLVAMALTSRKAMFQLKPADGAIGSYGKAVREISEDFRQLAQKIAEFTQVINWPNFANYSHNASLTSEYKDIPNDLPIHLIKQGDWLFRMHNNSRKSLYFNRSNNSRFASPDSEYGVFYAELDYYATFRETLQPNSTKLIDIDLLERMCLSKFHLQRNLRLIDLSGNGLTLIGADSRIFTGSYQLSQSWSQILYHHPASVDGLYYRSRYDPGRFCVVLYENRVRLTDLQEQRVTQNNLLDESFAATLQQILQEYKYQLGG